jgi:biopolymer transport protein ExbD
VLYQKRRKRPEMNLVPLIDVLVMLIFFAFVTMQFKSAATLNITLPKVETAGKNEFKGKVTIGIDKDGSVSFNNKNVTDEQLLALLRKCATSTRTSPC